MSMRPKASQRAQALINSLNAVSQGEVCKDHNLFTFTIIVKELVKDIQASVLVKIQAYDAVNKLDVEATVTKTVPSKGSGDTGYYTEPVTKTIVLPDIGEQKAFRDFLEEAVR